MSRLRNQLTPKTKTSQKTTLKRVGAGAIALSLILAGFFTYNRQNQQSSQLSEQYQQSNQGAGQMAQAAQAQQEAAQMHQQQQAAQQQLQQQARQAQTKSSASSSRANSAQGSAGSMGSGVSWGMMTAKVQGNKGALLWGTNMQRNSKYFVVERSLDKNDFEKLGKVDAAGNSNTYEEYFFPDESLAETQMPRAYYRVKQIGLDGKTYTSETIEHDLGLELGLYAAIKKEESPEGKLKILYAGDQRGKLSLRVLKMSGEKIYDQELEGDFLPQETLLAINDWEAGKYFLQLANDKTSVIEEFEIN